MAATVICLAYASYEYDKEVYTPVTNRYPEKAGNFFRRAIYYTYVEPDINKAIDYYVKAQEACKEAGMDQWSDEVIEIKMLMFVLHERFGRLAEAAFGLEATRDALLTESEKALLYPDDRLDSVGRQKRRTRLLGKAVDTSLRLSEVYANPYSHRDAEALEAILWAIDTVRDENESRKSIGASTESHGSFISREEFGAKLEALVKQYKDENDVELALPLSLQYQNWEAVNAGENSPNNVTER